MAREAVVRQFGQFLRILRGDKSLKQIELRAKSMGIHLPTQTLQSYEKGRAGAAINRERIEELARLYGESSERLVDEYVKSRFRLSLRQAPNFSEGDLYENPTHADLHKLLQEILESSYEATIRAIDQNIREFHAKVNDRATLEKLVELFEAQEERLRLIEGREREARLQFVETREDEEAAKKKATPKSRRSKAG